MISTLILFFAIALELILVVRGLQQGLARRYPAFYTYIAFVLATDTLVYAIRSNAHVYVYFYWIAEFLSLVLGCLVLLEFYRVALASVYPRNRSNGACRSQPPVRRGDD